VLICEALSVTLRKNTVAMSQGQMGANISNRKFLAIVIKPVAPVAKPAVQVAQPVAIVAPKTAPKPIIPKKANIALTPFRINLRRSGSTPRLILKWQGKLSKSKAIARYIRKHGKQGKDGKRGKSKAFAHHMQKQGNQHKSKAFAHYIKKFWKKSPTAGLNDNSAAKALLSKQVSQKKQGDTPEAKALLFKLVHKKNSKLPTNDHEAIQNFALGSTKAGDSDAPGAGALLLKNKVSQFNKTNSNLSTSDREALDIVRRAQHKSQTKKLLMAKAEKHIKTLRKLQEMLMQEQQKLYKLGKGMIKLALKN
jgi:hypothetical protein